MESLAAAARTAYAERLDQEHFDVLVIGGGITGAGVALDAAARGYHVALAEKADFASGTSSKSTKLAHGGIPFPPQFIPSRAHEARVHRGPMARPAPFPVGPPALAPPVSGLMGLASRFPLGAA